MPEHRDTSGVAVVQHPEKGRLLVATRSFAPGEMVLVEPPLITYRSPKQAVVAYLRLSSEQRAQFLESLPADFVYSGPRHELCREFTREYMSVADSIVKKLNGAITLIEARAVICATQFNCFTFDAAGQMYSETTAKEQSTFASYYLGGKILHSCEPNTIYTSSVFPGSGSFAALRPIQEGEIITAALVDCMDGTITRRKGLLSQRDFACDCPRCTRRDIASGIACERPGCTGTKFGFHRSPEDKTLQDYQCNECGDTTMPDLSVESELADRVSAIGVELRAMPDMPATIPKMEELLQEIRTRLSPTHHLAWQLLKMLSRAYCSYAIFLDSNEDKKGAAHYRFKSAITGTYAVKVMECIGAYCPLGHRCHVDHPPRVGKPETILWVCMDMLKCTPSNRRSLYPVVEKYIPYMRSVYGDDDDDLCKVVEALRRAGRHVEFGPPGSSGQSAELLAQRLQEQLLLEEEQERQARKQQQQKSSKPKQGKKKGKTAKK